MGRKKLLAAFLEKDNLKLLVFEGKDRVFAGQITFAAEVVKDAFIADAPKFNSQVKVAFAQKPPLREAADVVLFLPPDKTFTKTMEASDSVDGFVQSLPYFREELILSSEGQGSRVKPFGFAQGKGQGERVTHVAFEKKLIEDLQRPFLESGKTIAAVRSGINDLVAAHPQEGDYLLLVPLEKEVAFAVGKDGAVVEAGSFKTDLFVTRFGEYVVNHNLGEVKTAYTLGIFPKDLAEKIHHANGLNLNSLESTDVYDLIVSPYLRKSQTGLAGLLGRVDLSGITSHLPGQRKVFLVGAAAVGVLLVVLIVNNAGRLKLGGKKPETVSPVGTTAPPQPVAPEPKPGDYPVRILNGTLVEGEAGRLADKLKGLGFNVVETKNATSAGFVATRVRTASGVPDKIVATVKTALTDTYQSVNVEPLASDSAGVKIEIIIGQKKGS